MFRTLFTRRGGVTLVTATLAVSGMSLALAGTAGAVDPHPNASLIIGSGSQTSYSTMTTLTNLFNGAPGCDLTGALADSPNLNCGTQPVGPPGTSGGEQGFAISAENPYNDYSVQAPAIGSGLGKDQLVQSGLGTPTTRIDYARSSSSPDTHTGTAQNYVQYAVDGVSWTTFNKIGGVLTAHSAVKTISTVQLQAIYSDTLQCIIGGVTVHMDWRCLSTKVLSPQRITCYMAQYGSGTYATWQGALGFAKKAPPACANDPLNNVGGTTLASHSNLFENQMAYISTQADAANALYFMSFGKYTATCKSAKCAGSGNDLTTYGAINGIKASQATIQGPGGGVPGTFPVRRGLYNIYNNSSAVVPSSEATLNMVSEYGFLCKQSTSSDIDPQTNVSYRSEIEAAIKAQGFYPINTSSGAFPEGTVPFPAVLSDASYTAIDPTVPTNGFCLVSHG